MKYILIMNFLVFFMFNMGNPMIPAMLEDKASPDYVNGFLYAAMNLSQFVFSPIVILFYKRFKPKHMIMVGPFLYGIGQLGFAVFQSPAMMIACRMFSGIAVAFVGVSTLMYMHSVKGQDDRFNRYSLLFASNSLGGICGLYFSSLISSFGIYTPFYLQSVFGFIFIFIIYILLSRVDEPDVNPKKDNIIDNISVVVASKKVATLFILMTLFITCFVIYNSNINNFATNVYDITTKQSSYLSMFNSTLVLVSNLILVNVVRKFKVFNILLTISLGLGVMLLILSGYTSLITAILTFSFLVLSLNIVRPIITSELVKDLDTNSAAKYLSATNSVNAFASVVAGVATGIVYSFNPFYMFYLIFLILVVIVLILISRRKYV